MMAMMMMMKITMTMTMTMMMMTMMIMKTMMMMMMTTMTMMMTITMTMTMTMMMMIMMVMTMTMTMTMMMMMMMMTIVEMKMIVVKIIIDIIPRSTSTLVHVGKEIPISQQINVDNLLLYYVNHVLMLDGIISIVSIRKKILYQNKVDISLLFNTSLCSNYSLLAEVLLSLVLGPEEGKETV